MAQVVLAMTHSFDGQLRRGSEIERALDTHFAETYEIRKATMAEQRMGIDRLFTDIGSRQVFRVEYKADWRSADTGNAFIETVSVDSQGIQGWAHTSMADWLVYALPQQRRYLLVRVPELRGVLDDWIRRFPQGKARNPTYSTHGVLVPITELEKLSHYDGTY